jgi:hypothetical protein
MSGDDASNPSGRVRNVTRSTRHDVKVHVWNGLSRCIAIVDSQIEVLSIATNQLPHSLHGLNKFDSLSGC